MRLCVFKTATGPRLGHVRRNHVVDLSGMDPALPTTRRAVATGDAALKQTLAAFAQSCPHPTTLLRKADLQILDEWESS